MSNEPVHIFCESANAGSNKENFALVLKSGGVDAVFIFSPDHMKQLARLLTDRVTQWEKAYGVLEGRLSGEPVKSPYEFGQESNAG